MTTKTQLTPQNSSTSVTGITTSNSGTNIQQNFTNGKNISQTSISSTDLNKTMIRGPDTFIIVKYGSNRDVIFNTNCKVSLFSSLPLYSTLCSSQLDLR
jgi:hypothetical protein